MTKKAARNKLEKQGYEIITLMQGGYMAKKFQRTYKADTLNGLIKIIF